jgi:hypothetical protein
MSDKPNVNKVPKSTKSPRSDKSASQASRQAPQGRDVIEKRGGQTTPKHAPIPPRSSALPKPPPPPKSKS